MNEDTYNLYLAPVGYKYSFNSKMGGGEYVVIGHINCERCNTAIEQREWQEPSRKHRKIGHYYREYVWCHKCGLFKPNLDSKVILFKPEITIG